MFHDSEEPDEMDGMHLLEVLLHTPNPQMLATQVASMRWGRVVRARMLTPGVCEVETVGCHGLVAVVNDGSLTSVASAAAEACGLVEEYVYSRFRLHGPRSIYTPDGWIQQRSRLFTNDPFTVGYRMWLAADGIERDLLLSSSEELRASFERNLELERRLGEYGHLEGCCPFSADAVTERVKADPLGQEFMAAQEAEVQKILSDWSAA